MSLVFTHTLHRARATTVEDRYGNEVPVPWDTAPTVAVPGWAIDAGDTSEDREAREGTVVEYTARHLGRVDLTEDDRLVYDGALYEVEGKIRYQPGPSARTSHTIVRLRRAEG